jgi:hypothetical protein
MVLDPALKATSCSTKQDKQHPVVTGTTRYMTTIHAANLQLLVHLAVDHHLHPTFQQKQECLLRRYQLGRAIGLYRHVSRQSGYQYYPYMPHRPSSHFD